MRSVWESVWEMSAQCWPGSVTEGGVHASRGWLRRFVLLKLVTVLLFPHGTGLPMLVSCVFSLRALWLLHSPHVSTKPSTVLLAQLAFTDGLLLLQWALQLGMALCWWTEGEAGCEAEVSPVRDTVSAFCQELLDAHHLASLLLLALLGLEATLVSRWPQQTRRFRTSQQAQLCCSLVWMLVLIELASKLLQNVRRQTYLSALPGLSLCLRRTLWLVDSWLHYAVLKFKPQRRRSSFH
ncbi:uncharacterized protein LOC106518946 [Austrofundulus limnaeus]|uniref:Uncharacterized protein LOC106518946 n=1 Tax=Austrofundulus limnaeus TaxID=52670 RepID=A0A2I4BDN6_AUSLI|nr:PREDICTED: uncharacterized protein LOC106518946 [Austrofundulus limnaeus]